MVTLSTKSTQRHSRLLGKTQARMEADYLRRKGQDNRIATRPGKPKKPSRPTRRNPRAPAG